ncbi:MAG: ABC transporter permease [Rubrivivax sp.]|jgi:NitT/TauT family transport system permease protein/taurine transport system permease protein|nr:ABC transporter permease [Rubrivivax sp.]
MSDPATIAQPPSALTPDERAAIERLHRSPGWFHRVARFLGLGAFFALWQIVSVVVLPRIDANLVTLMPPPTEVLRAAWELLQSGELLRHFWASLKREAVAFAYALVAIPLGVAMGWSRTMQSLLEPVFEMLRPIPPIAWIPLAILWFGISDLQNQFIIFLGIFFPLLINTIAGVKNVEHNIVRAARCLGASEFDVLVRVVFRAALPQIVTGVRVGLGVGWMALVAAELVGATSGLGWLISDARSVLRTDIILVGMISIGLAGLVIDQGLRWVAKKTLPWSLAMTK